MAESKLPRGSFFYIRLGHLYYGGKAPIKVTVREHVTAMLPTAQARALRWGLSRWSRGWQPNKPHCRPVLVGLAYGGKSQEVTRHTGMFKDILVEDFEQAKQFRRRSQAESVLEDLKRSHAAIGIVPQILLKEGTPQ